MFLTILFELWPLSLRVFHGNFARCLDRKYCYEPQQPTHEYKLNFDERKMCDTRFSFFSITICFVFFFSTNLFWQRSVSRHKTQNKKKIYNFTRWICDNFSLWLQTMEVFLFFFPFILLVSEKSFAMHSLRENEIRHSSLFDVCITTEQVGRSENCKCGCYAVVVAPPCDIDTNKQWKEDILIHGKWHWQCFFIRYGNSSFSLFL